jgi:hypothetical protein
LLELYGADPLDLDSDVAQEAPIVRIGIGGSKTREREMP